MKRLILVLMFGFIFTLSASTLAAPQAIDIPKDYVGGQCGLELDPWHYSQSDMGQGVKVTYGFRSNTEQMRLHRAIVSGGRVGYDYDYVSDWVSVYMTMIRRSFILPTWYAGNSIKFVGLSPLLYVSIPF